MEGWNERTFKKNIYFKKLAYTQLGLAYTQLSLAWKLDKQ